MSKCRQRFKDGAPIFGSYLVLWESAETYLKETEEQNSSEFSDPNNKRANSGLFKSQNLITKGSIRA